MWARGEPASVLVLYSDTGGGHRAAAKAVVAALTEVDPSVRVATCDPLLGEGTPAVRKVISSYPWIITQAQPLWGVIYHATNTRPTWMALRTSFTRQVGQVVGRKLAELDPDLVVSVHPLVTQPAWRAIQRSGRRRGLMTVVTDLVDIHRSWAFPQLDRLVVPTQEAWQVVTGYGVPKQSVQLLGLPVDLRFRPPAPGEREALRRRWGLAENRPTVLVMGGGEGSGRLLQQVRALAWMPHDWQVIAVCGRNERLRRRLSRLHFRTPTLVLGFVDTVPDLLRASDLVVTKAGPGAIAEALATQVPMVLTGHLPGQEAPNVRYVTHTGVGLHAPRPDQLEMAVDYLLADGGAEARVMAGHTAKVAHPYASLDIARECLDLAARYGAASHARR